ncbi:MAG: aldo/keto reductase [Tannerella sp.]|jgi:aryl-alcohol dehydrogenase-like predicted oxidoreductase|nr:aldo/keto reductase [Tannerella sp.]
MNPSNKLILGTVQFGLPYGINNSTGQVLVPDVAKILVEAKDNGISVLDTSYAYGDSEAVLGELLEKDDYFKIVSKIPQTAETPKSIFEETTKRLKKDKLYGYLVHHFEYFKENPSIWADIKALQKDGRIEKTGFSLYNIRELEYLFSKNVRFDIVQIPYNLLDRAFEPYLKELKQRNVEIHTRSVFLQGLFFKSVDDLPEQLKPLKPYLVDISNFCKEQNITVEELALNGVIHRSDIDGVLVGVDNIVQLQRNIRSIWTEASAKIVEYIDSLDVKEKELLNPVNWN